MKPLEMSLFQHPKLSRAWPLYLLLLTLPAVIPLFLYGLPINFDNPTHLLRIARLHEAIEQGILFPRWMPNQLIGYGYPSLNYYASGSYYLVEILHWLGLPLYWAYAGAQSLLVFLAAVGMYLFARDLLDRKEFWPPLVAAIAYSYGPYFLNTLYVRGAIAEQAAQMLLPWILWSFRRIWRSDRPQAYIVGASLALAALAFTHTISLLLIPPFLVGYIATLAWETKARAQRLQWTAIALGGAMAISCFYWLPLIAERGYVSTLGYSISQQRFLPYSFLEAKNVLLNSLSYIYTEEIDYRLSLLQIIGVVAGLPFVVRRWHAGGGKEWGYWIEVLVLCALLMTKLTYSLWLSHELFAIIQFPYRLLGLFQIPVALLTMLPFASISHRQLRIAASLLAVSCLIWAFWPRLPWVQTLSPTTSIFSMPMNVNFEVDIKQILDGGQIATSLQEFRPRWVSTTLELDPASVETPSLLGTVTPLAANPLHVRIQTTSPTAFPLRLNTFFFPGWEVTLDDSVALTPYPSTTLGLLTAEVPAGEHILEIRWAGTLLAFWAALISQLALLGFLVWQLTQPRFRAWILVLAPLLLVAAVARYWQPPLAQITPLSSDDQIPGVRLVGLGQPEVGEEGITLYPYWYALETQPPELTVRWQLQNARGDVVAQMEATPFYDAYSAENWPAGTLIDDAQLFPLPDGLPAGEYQLLMTPLDEATATPFFTMPLGAITLDAPTPQPAPAHALDLTLGEDVALKGYRMDIVDQWLGELPLLPQATDVAILRPGQNIVYSLYWQLLAETDEPYSGFVHLTNHQGVPLVQRDQSPGPIFAPVSIWATGRIYQDDYMLTIPDDAASGLYWPQVGMYNWEDVERFAVKDAEGQVIGDHYTLPPVKIINPTVKAVGHTTEAHFGEMATLVGYTAHNAQGNEATETLSVMAGSTLTLTAFYQVENPSPTTFTRFLQLRNAANQVVTQFDSEPQAGQNPTWAWVKNEIVQDTIHLLIPAETAPGDYTLYLGFYEPIGNFTRLPVTNGAGERLPNDELPMPQGNNFLVVQVVN